MNFSIQTVSLDDPGAKSNDHKNMFRWSFVLQLAKYFDTHYLHTCVALAGAALP